MNRALWIDPGFGASGDMLLGALLSLGAELDQITQGLERLGFDGWSVEQETVLRCGLSSTRAVVDAPPSTHHRSWSAIDQLIADASLPDRVANGARSTFRRLGEVEAAQHGVEIDEVHFHEVGAVDAIVDIVGVWLALDQLDVASVSVGPVGLGHGSVRAAHGILPLPAPATVALLTGAPVRSLDIELETCTPTGAALLSTLGEWGPLPDGVLVDSGRGAGGRNPATHPNVVTAIVLETAPTKTTSGDAVAEGEGEGEGEGEIEPVRSVILATNLDDTTPEVLGHTMQRLLESGADDAWVTPIIMKKNRPAHELNVLAAPELADRLRRLMALETGTLGVRVTLTTKHPLTRKTEEVVVRGGTVRIKVGPHSAKPEHDDLVALSTNTGVPIRLLADEARQAWAGATTS